MKQIILRKYPKGSLFNRRYGHWKYQLLGLYEDGSEWFTQGYKTRQEAFGEAFWMCNLRSKDRMLVCKD